MASCITCPIERIEVPVEGIEAAHYSRVYDYFFMLLQLSPSYRMAHLEAGGVPLPIGLLLPRNFDAVREAYDTFGPVWTTLFRDWWRDRGARGFGIKSIRKQMTNVAAVANIANSGSTDAFPFSDAIDELQKHISAAEGMSFDLIAVPRVGSLKDRANAVVRLLEVIDQENTEVASATRYSLIRPRPTDESIITAWQCAALWAGLRKPKGPGRPAKLLGADGGLVSAPSIPRHRIGKRLGLTGAVEDDLRFPTKFEAVNDPDNEVIITRRMLGVLTNGLRLMENAARGQYPLADQLPVDRSWLDACRPFMRSYMKGHLAWLREQMGPYRDEEVLTVEEATELLRQGAG